MSAGQTRIRSLTLPQASLSKTSLPRATLPQAAVSIEWKWRSGLRRHGGLRQGAIRKEADVVSRAESDPISDPAAGTSLSKLRLIVLDLNPPAARCTCHSRFDHADHVACFFRRHRRSRPVFDRRAQLRVELRPATAL